MVFGWRAALALIGLLPSTASATLELTFAEDGSTLTSASTATTFKTNAAAIGTLSNAAGQAFLDQNRNAPGVGALPNGLQLKICAIGPGTETAMPTTPVTVHYEGRLAENYPNGPTFDSSFERGEPSTFQPDGVILGWGMALVNFMNEGSVFELYIPSELAYGEQGTPDGVVPPGSVLVFTLQLISINGPGQPMLDVSSAPVGGCPPLPEVSSGSSNMALYALFALVLVAGGGYYYYKKKKEKDATGKLTSVPPPTQAGVPPPPTQGDAGYVAPAPLPADWQEMKDENTGRAYFYNKSTGESSWVRPGADKV